MPVNYRFKQRRGTAAEWAAANPVLAEGEIGVEVDNDPALPDRFKIGDGVTSWTGQPYSAATPADVDAKAASGHLHSGTYAEMTGGVRKVTGPTLPAYESGTKYVWEKTDATTGDLLDIETGVMA